MFAKLSVKDMLVRVRSLEKVTAIELGTGAWPGSDHVNVDAYLNDWHFWAFNVADAAITIGVAFILVDVVADFLGYHRAPNPV